MNVVGIASALSHDQFVELAAAYITIEAARYSRERGLGRAQARDFASIVLSQEVTNIGEKLTDKFDSVYRQFKSKKFIPAVTVLAMTEDDRDVVYEALHEENMTAAYGLSENPKDFSVADRAVMRRKIEHRHNIIVEFN